MGGVREALLNQLQVRAVAQGETCQNGGLWGLVAPVSPQSDDITKVTQAAKIVERMVNQNTYDDVAQGKI